MASGLASGVDRRRFVALLGVGVTGAVLAAPARSQLRALAAASGGPGGLGPLGPADEHGVRVPEGFTTRLVGRTGDVVPGTAHVWHGAPDGGGCVPAGDGHVYVSNSELAAGLGGVSAVEFDPSGRVRSARTILSGTSMNCSGGVTPWGTWLSCEEVDPDGSVWECDPAGGPAVARPAMGRFRHEAVAVDAARRQVFLTEDHPSGRLYRFRPAGWPDLAVGVLEAAAVDTDGVVTWHAVDPGVPARAPGTTTFDGGEGAVVSGASLFFTTKGDRRVWELDLVRDRLRVFHDCVARPDTPLTHVDNLAVHPLGGDLFVAEDGGDMDLCMLSTESDPPTITRVVRFEGHDGSEVAGPAFSPDGRFLYVSSQRGVDGRGITVQVEGPWHRLASRIDRGAEASTSAMRLGNARPVGDD